MTERDALLRAVLADPADDTVRLAFADWLDENGESERAEFIRVQVELAKLESIDLGEVNPIGPPTPSDLHTLIVQSNRVTDQALHHTVRYCDQGTTVPQFGKIVSISGEYVGLPRPDRVAVTVARLSGWEGLPREKELRKRERELLAAGNAKQWLGALNGLRPWWSEMKGCGWQVLPDGAVYAEFTRGFVSRVTLTQADFLRHAGGIFAAHPVTAVTLSDREPDVRAGMRGINDDWFDWFPPGTEDRYARARLSEDLWWALLRTRGVVREPYCLGHETRDLALAALSAACVAYGRELAGLPPLTAASTPSTSH